MAARAPMYFTDENTLDLGELLRRAGRDDVVYPGHEGLPEVPVGTRRVGRTAVQLLRDSSRREGPPQRPDTTKGQGGPEQGAG